MRHAEFPSLYPSKVKSRPAFSLLRLLTSIVPLLLCACDSRINNMADTDLQDRMYECRAALSQNPGFAISCDNYRRECLRRREQGKFLC